MASRFRLRTISLNQNQPTVTRLARPNYSGAVVYAVLCIPDYACM